MYNIIYILPVLGIKECHGPMSPEYLYLLFLYNII